MAFAVLALSCSLRGPLAAQGATLAGVVRASSGAAIPNATVSATDSGGRQRLEARTDTAGHYRLSPAFPGTYALVVAADGYDTARVTVTVAAGAAATADVTLEAALSLGDLGFSAAQTRGSAEEQARLDRRSHMLQVHQRLGLITAVPFLATAITGGFAGGRATHKTVRDVHLGLAVLTVGMYGTAASFAIRAPKIPGTKTRGPIRLHKALAWIHGPGMLLTPVLGAMAYDQRSRGERVHGIARAHGIVAIVTASAYALAMLSVSLRF